MCALIWLLASLASIYITIQVSLVALRNYKAHRFFSIRAPKLPVVFDKPTLFAGHLRRVILRNDNVQAIAQLHQQLGPTFGYYFCDQPWVSTKDLDLIKLIEVEQAHKHRNRAPLGLPFSYFNHSIFQVNDNAWRSVRSAVAPALTNRNVRSEQTTSDIESVLEQLAAGLKSRAAAANEHATQRRSIVLDAGDMSQRYTLAVIFLVAYQREQVVDFFGPKDGWVARIDSAARQLLNPFVVASLAFPFIRPLIEFFMNWHPVGRMNKEIIGYIKEAIQLNRVARERTRKNMSGVAGEGRAGSHTSLAERSKGRLVDTIIEALVGRRITLDESIGSLQFLLLAAFETTADIITCLIWQLARHAEIQERLRECLASEGLDSQYLDWCVKETIRYHPAAPLGAGRILGADVQVKGVLLPKGTFVMPSIHAIHHEPEIWPAPEEFRPERWQQQADHHPAAFMGFGLGARNCVGGKLAMHEIKLVIRLLLASYRIEPCPETPDKYAFSSPFMIFTLTDAPIMVRLVEVD